MGKYISFRAPGQERFMRSKTLGEAYTVEAITERIAGTYRAKPKELRQEKLGVSMLIDIQNSIRAAESKGYEQLQAVLDDVYTESEQTIGTLNDLENISPIYLCNKNGVSQHQCWYAYFRQLQTPKYQSLYMAPAHLLTNALKTLYNVIGTIFFTARIILLKNFGKVTSADFEKGGFYEIRFYFNH